MRRRKQYIIFILLGIALLTSCKQVTVKIDKVPANTPEGAQIYITGNFNNWNPADPNFVMEHADSAYYIKLPYGFGILQYKFTRGSWETVETDECGHEIENRMYHYLSNDTIVNTISSWNDKEPLDCPRLTIIIDSVPENTPDTAIITIAGNFNEWNPFDEAYRLIRNSKGGYQITMMKPKEEKEIEFKFTRGDLSKVEADKFGNELPRRSIKFGVTDTIVTSIRSWEDLTDMETKNITIVIDKVPSKTYRNDKLYLTGNVNGWYPKERDYQFEKQPDGTYSLNLPRKDGKLEFKITRGSWESQELDEKGVVISNRTFEYKTHDSIFIAVENWADRLPAQKLIFRVFKVPENTPEDDDIYIVGNFNGWDPEDRRFKMEKTPDGDYIKEVDIDNKYVEYKFTRGGWDTEEANVNGYKIENRVHKYIGIDTIHVAIKNWFDLPGHNNLVTIVLEEIPEYTPEKDEIYFASNINDWDPSNRNYILQEKEGKYYITLKIRQREIYYKFTRGNWRSVEGDRRGEEIGNRKLFYNAQDTVYHRVLSWKDIHRP